MLEDFRGVFEPLLSPSAFAEVRIEGNSLAWPDGADIDPLVLWAVTGEPIVFNDGSVAPGYEDRVRH